MSSKVNYRRDSFSDRFCDDLCEDILRYLPLQDKFRQELVSKQFQRTVFQRQYELYISFWDHKIYLNKIFKSVHNYHFKDQSLGSINALLKKCPNITSFEWAFRGLQYIGDETVNEVFRLIIENCNNLNQFIVCEKLNESNFEEFQKKFGPQLKCLKIRRKFVDWNLFPNIEKAKLDFIHIESIIPQLNLGKLKGLEIVFYGGQEHVFQTVIDTFPTLTHLNVLFNSFGGDVIYKPLKNISNLKHLIHFFIRIESERNINRFSELLKEMSNICMNLKSIDCHFNFDQNSNIRQFFCQLKTFPLKRLDLWLNFFNYEVEEDIDVNQLFSFELFKGFENITHLTLSLNRKHIPKESILKEIDINLPKLQYLEIRNKFDTTPEGVTKMADILSRLLRLETLKLKFKSGVDFKPIEEQITEKCRKIKEIEIESVSDPNPEIIRSL